MQQYEFKNNKTYTSRCKIYLYEILQQAKL